MRYVLQRFIQFLIVFFIVTFGVMVLLRLGLDAPGDPARTLLGGTPTQEEIDATTEKYHLDSNYFVQYWYWLTVDAPPATSGFSVQQPAAGQHADRQPDHDDAAARHLRDHVRRC